MRMILTRYTILFYFRLKNVHRLSSQTPESNNDKKHNPFLVNWEYKRIWLFDTFCERSLIKLVQK